LAQGVPALESSSVAVFLHALCSDLAMVENNEYSLTAGDLIEYIPRSMNYIIRREFVKEKGND
jgi:NAD(P)H-hydrate repair Nnr-like enzyme with NAD(P)H-hydrate dehydratase domain